MTEKEKPYRGAIRGPNVSEDLHRRTIDAFIRRQEERAAQRAAEAAEVERLLAEAAAKGRPTTSGAIRLALAERKAAEDRLRAERSVAAARLAVGLDVPSVRLTVDDVRRWGEALRESDGTPPTQQKVAEEMGCSVRWVYVLCRDHGGYRAVVPNRKS